MRSSCKNIVVSMALSAVVLTLGALSSACGAADPIKIGVVNEITGPQAEAGAVHGQRHQARAGGDQQSGGVLGPPDRAAHRRQRQHQSRDRARLLQAHQRRRHRRHHRADPQHADPGRLADDRRRRGIPTMIGGTDPSLTHVNNRWVFRARPNDCYSSRVIADFGVNTLKLKKWAIVHSTDAFGSGGKKALIEALKALGVTPVLIQGYTNNSQDFTPIVLAIKKSGADILATYMTNSPDVGIFAKQLRQLGVNMPWVGSPSIISVTALNLAGEALYGTYAIADFTTDADEQSRAFTKKYRGQVRHQSGHVRELGLRRSAHPCRSPSRTRTAPIPKPCARRILAINGYKGVEGTYEFDQNGDGLHGYNVVKNEGGKIVFIKRVEFPPQ